MARIIKQFNQTRLYNFNNKLNFYIRWLKFKMFHRIMDRNFKGIVKLISVMIIKCKIPRRKIIIPIIRFQITMRLFKKTNLRSTKIHRIMNKRIKWMPKKMNNHKNPVNDKFITFLQMFSRWPKSTKCCRKDLNLMSSNRCKNKRNFIKRKRRDSQIIW